MKKITIPADKKELLSLRAGDAVEIYGTIYTARDAAHKRLCEMIASGEELPFELENAVIYYTGPCPKKEGQIINSCGPTTSGRMNKYAPTLYEKGAAGAIGKGPVSNEVKQAMQKAGAVYFIATGGAGALISLSVTEMEEIAFPELGAESIKRLKVAGFPAIVGVDAFGGDVYISGPEAYKKQNGETV